MRPRANDKPRPLWYNAHKVKKVTILGATGSIGTCAAEVARSRPGDFRIVAVSALRSRERCEALAREFGAKAYVGEGSALRAVEENDADVCLVATVGRSGLAPTFAALDRGMDVALATKEVIVMAGDEAMERARARGRRILPVDSEHSAIFQCLQAGSPAGSAKGVSKLTLTASGGPFLDGPPDLSKVTPAQALAHPKWKMGPKVTVDSSTMMNKGFEIIEACRFFGVPPERVEVVVHPECLVHSLVEFEDGSTLAQLSQPDMRIAVQYALSWPERLPAERKPLDLTKSSPLTFRPLDERRFPCVSIAREALRLGGLAPAALSVADEFAVDEFLSGRIRHTDIPRLLEKAILEPEKWISSSQLYT